MNPRDEDLIGWAGEAVRHAWKGTRIERHEALRGDLSARRFWRVFLEGRRAPRSAILVDLGPDDLPGYARALKLLAQPPEEPPWLSVHRFLSGLHLPVPALYAVSLPLRAMLVEDVGETSLIDFARAHPEQTPDFFRAAVELALRLHTEGTARLPNGLPSARISYDEPLFRWELKEFVDLGCAALGMRGDAPELGAELDLLARRLGSLPRVFSHRDFHGQNLFVQRDGADSRLRLIDFQDALMAPNAQDLAVLLTTRDMSDLVSPDLEQRLLEFYYAGLLRRRAASMSPEQFFESYELCVLQHALKMIGRFMMFERNGKPGYGAFVPYAIAQARRILSGPRAGEFPALAAGLRADSPEDCR